MKAKSLSRGLRLAALMVILVITAGLLVAAKPPPKPRALKVGSFVYDPATCTVAAYDINWKNYTDRVGVALIQTNPEGWGAVVLTSYEGPEPQHFEMVGASQPLSAGTEFELCVRLEDSAETFSVWKCGRVTYTAACQ